MGHDNKLASISFHIVVDTPDPYVQVNIPGSRTSSKKTSYKNNEFNPQWDETFKFHIDLKKAPTIGKCIYIRHRSDLQFLVYSIH